MPVCDLVSGVLIVSPNGELRRELMSRVKSERWRLTEAVSGAHALGQLETEDFQLLLLDSFPARPQSERVSENGAEPISPPADSAAGSPDWIAAAIFRSRSTRR